MRARNAGPEPTNRRTRRVLIGGGLVLLGSMIVIPALAVDINPVDAALRELDEEYEQKAEALPQGPDQTLLNEGYEKARAELLDDMGLVALNGPDPSPNPAEDERNLPPDGIHEANENPEGYALTNFWVHEFENGDYIYVAAAFAEGDQGRGGVLIMDPSGEDFYFAPKRIGPLTIKSVDGTWVRLVGEGGDAVIFDYVEREFSSGI